MNLFVEIYKHDLKMHRMWKYENPTSKFHLYPIKMYHRTKH